ncbi:MAG TPA: DUF202 domain-containing protein [Thermopolyspora sp.]
MTYREPRETPIWDSGLQSERTRLAWVRTATTLAAGGLAGGGLALRSGAPALAIIGFCLAAGCGAVLLARTGIRYDRIQRALHAHRALNQHADAVIAWIGTLAAACSGLVVALCLA